MHELYLVKSTFIFNHKKYLLGTWMTDWIFLLITVTDFIIFRKHSTSYHDLNIHVLF